MASGLDQVASTVPPPVQEQAVMERGSGASSRPVRKMMLRDA
jgi:hypothetical protein